MEKMSTDDFPVLMERHLKLRSIPDGMISDIVIQVGYPVWIQPNLEASCAVAIRGVAGRMMDIRGVDPIDAMKNVMLFIESYLEDGQGEVRFFWPNGEKY